MKIYIAGPMRGIPLFNFPAFDAMEKTLKLAGDTVVNPAQIDRDSGLDPEELPDNHNWWEVPDGLSLGDIVTRDVHALKSCDAIYLLNGWENSQGANAEKAVAEWLGLEVFFQSEKTPTATRHNSGKPELSQLCHFRLDALAAHCTAGRLKYPDVEGIPNWTLGGKPDQEYLDAACRHIVKHVIGEVYDAETGTMHAAAVAWNMLAMITNNYSDLRATSNEN